MKKSILLWMSAVLMLSVGMMSCSNDDDDSTKETVDLNGGSSDAVDNDGVIDENHKNIIGEWQLLNYHGGCYATVHMSFEPGEVTVTFAKDGVVTINGKEGYYGFPVLTGTYNYSFEEVIPYKAKEPITLLAISPYSIIEYYYFHFENGTLVLSDYGCSGPYEYNFKKVK